MHDGWTLQLPSFPIYFSFKTSATNNGWIRCVMTQKSVALADNFAFCAIDTNVAPIAVPDCYLWRRLAFLIATCSHLANLPIVSRPYQPSWNGLMLQGWPKGVHRGEGLGDHFLGTLRERVQFYMSWKHEYVMKTLLYSCQWSTRSRKSYQSHQSRTQVAILCLMPNDDLKRQHAKDSNARDSWHRCKTTAEGVPARAIGLFEAQQFSITKHGAADIDTSSTIRL
jgi:hypothetical protein